MIYEIKRFFYDASLNASGVCLIFIWEWVSLSGFPIYSSGFACSLV